MQTKYKAANGAHLSDKDAERYGRRLDTLMKKTGSITPPFVLEDAKDRNSPLHDYFEWNDGVAAVSYRIEQAKTLIRGIVIEVINNGNKEEVRAFYSVSSDAPMDEGPKQVYVSFGTVQTDSAKRGEVVAYAKRELRGWTERYRQYRELGEMVRFIEAHI